MKLKPGHYSSIPVVIGNRRNFSHKVPPVGNRTTLYVCRKPRRERCFQQLRYEPHPGRSLREQTLDTPSIYVLNAAALSKRGTVQQLAADLQSYGVSVAVITETHYKAKHSDSIVNINGFTLYRRDRVGRREGGVALYVATGLRSTRWTPAVATDKALEIEWVRVNDTVFVAALYNPPRPVYRPEVLLEHLEACVAEITHDRNCDCWRLKPDV